MERLQKIIANSGYCSRRKAEKLIESGKVEVDGKNAKIGDIVGENSKIKINGKFLKKNNEKYYFVLNKPKGILVTRDDPNRRKTIYDLESVKGAEEKFGRLNSVGRLDGLSEGLLILTNDGELQNKLTHPSSHVEKTYLLRVWPKLKESAIGKLKRGLMIGGRKLFADVKPKENNEFEITISEGRNRIIRKAMEKLGYKIFMLKRIRVGNFELGKLGGGEVKKIDKLAS